MIPGDASLTFGLFTIYLMKVDTLKVFAKLQDALVAEKSMIEGRLEKINALLGRHSFAPSEPHDGRFPGSVSTNGGMRRKYRRGPRAGMSLREAIAQATAHRPLTKPEILDAVKNLGYVFTTKRPLASINTTLYTGGYFQQQSGRYSPTKPKRNAQQP